MDRLAVALNKHGVGLVRDADDVLAGREMAAGFLAIGENTGLMFLKSNATVREVMHELVHFRQFRDLGFDGYQALRRTGGHETGVWRWFQSHPDKMGRLTNAEADAEMMNFFNWK